MTSSRMKAARKAGGSRYLGVLTLSMALACAQGCAEQSQPEAQAPESTGSGAADPILEAARMAGDYLVHSCGEQGRFVYSAFPDHERAPRPGYSMTVHAGALHSLAQYAARFPEQTEARECLTRATGFLRSQIDAVPSEEGLLALWSLPPTEPVAEQHASEPDAPESRGLLGGTGLSLAALCSLESQGMATTELETLRAMGRFLLFMQQENGSFHASYVPGEGRSEAGRGVYPPGQAALGLIMLYERDRSPQWIESALRALEYLALNSKSLSAVKDNPWALIAMARGLPHYAASARSPDGLERLLEHAVRICESTLELQVNSHKKPYLAGSFGSAGRTGRTALHVQGLLAGASVLPAEESGLRRRIDAGIESGIAFLTSTQIQSGRLRGGLPSGMEVRVSHPLVPQANDDSFSEVRLDGVRYFLGALLGYARYRSGD